MNVSNETLHLKRHEVLLHTSDSADDTASWYALALVFKGCIDFIHDAIE